MKKQILYIIGCSALLSSCHIYSNYERPQNIVSDSLYRDTTAAYAVLASDTANFGNMPWQEVFSEPQLQALINKVLVQNADIRTADLTIQQAEFFHKRLINLHFRCMQKAVGNPRHYILKNRMERWSGTMSEAVTGTGL